MIMVFGEWVELGCLEVVLGGFLGLRNWFWVVEFGKVGN